MINRTKRNGNGKAKDDINFKMLEAIKGGPAVADPPAAAPAPAADPGKVVQDQAPAADQGQGEDPAYGGNLPEWKKDKSGKAKSTVVPCIVIDKNDHWHGGAKVDLKGRDPTAYTWGYYGTQYPVLVEQRDGALMPFYLPDAVGENSNRLYKGAHPEGFRATFKHTSSILQKVQVGLMVALVLGIFLLMYVLINQKPANSNQPTGKPTASVIYRGELNGDTW